MGILQILIAFWMPRKFYLSQVISDWVVFQTRVLLAPPLLTRKVLLDSLINRDDSRDLSFVLFEGLFWRELNFFDSYTLKVILVIILNLFLFLNLKLFIKYLKNLDFNWSLENLLDWKFYHFYYLLNLVIFPNFCYFINFLKIQIFEKYFLIFKLLSNYFFAIFQNF